ncbi:MAG TPA: hypothetical protein VLT86_11865 [Vicinamibacterales bacterium]|nr:hypothetical protein [Vicinamibacterales bacterium]
MLAEPVIVAILVACVVLFVAAVGLRASPDDALGLVRQRGVLARSLLAMFVVMPAAAAFVARTFDLLPAVEIALVSLSLSPVPPLLPGRMLKAGSERSYAVGLLVAAAAVAIFYVPAAVFLLARVFQLSVSISPVNVAIPVASTVLAPLLAGMAIRRLVPGFADRAAQPLAAAAGAILGIGLVAVLVATWPTITLLLRNGTLVAFVAFSVAGLAVGHLLGGPAPGNRSALALSTAARHPGVALVIARANFPDQQMILPAILLYLCVTALATTVYLALRQRDRMAHTA